jgi:hypothetical protein
MILASTLQEVDAKVEQSIWFVAPISFGLQRLP